MNARAQLATPSGKTRKCAKVRPQTREELELYSPCWEYIYFNDFIVLSCLLLELWRNVYDSILLVDFHTEITSHLMVCPVKSKEGWVVERTHCRTLGFLLKQRLPFPELLTVKTNTETYNSRI